MPRFRATLAYDGSAYLGFQRQPEAMPSVQLAVERAITQITQQEATVLAAGRTDTGVHATGQVIAFDVEWKHTTADLLRAINAVLPDDIALQDLCIHEGFHPRYDARSRQYRYTVIGAAQRQPLMRNQAWHVHQPLDLTAMNRAAAMLVGKHDFATFGTPPQGNNTVREVFRSKWYVDQTHLGECTIYVIEGTAFLYHMVRRIVGLTVDVGRGHVTSEAFAEIFASRDLSQVRTMAPPQGLILEKVRYAEHDEAVSGDKPR